MMPILRSRRKIALLGIAALAFASIGAGTMFTGALFTDQQAVDNNVFTAGTIDLSASPASALFTVNAMMPGDIVNGTLTLSNAGTGQLRYWMTSSSTDTDSQGLAAELQLTIKTKGTDCATFDGTSVYTGVLDSAAWGSHSSGARTVAAAADDVLCFRVSMPSGAGNAYQGAATTTTFTFDAEQTANN